jgi:hypothetical protein
MNISKVNEFKLSNIGIYLNAVKGKVIFRITHTGLYAQTTDALLQETKGFIATQVSDTTGTVAASLIASTVLDRPAPDNVSETMPVVATVDGKDFQVAGLFVIDPKNVDDAQRRANAFMMKNEGTSLIDSSLCNPYGEVDTIHIVAYSKPL